MCQQHTYGEGRHTRNMHRWATTRGMHTLIVRQRHFTRTTLFALACVLHHMPMARRHTTHNPLGSAPFRRGHTTVVRLCCDELVPLAAQVQYYAARLRPSSFLGVTGVHRALAKQHHGCPVFWCSLPAAHLPDTATTSKRCDAASFANQRTCQLLWR